MGCKRTTSTINKQIESEVIIMATTDLNRYYNKLLSYRDLLDSRESQGKISEDKLYALTDKLNEWYETAKVLDRKAKKQKTTTQKG
jgi:hypothetical protein